MPRSVSADRIEAVRHFNRWYTQQVGALRGDLLATPYPLPQARVLFELAHRDGVTAADLAATLGLDRSYLSRLLAGLEKKGLVLRARDKADARRQSLALTAAGRRAFADLDRRSRDEVRAILAPLAPERERRLLGAMAAIEHVLGAGEMTEVPFTLRAHEPGDLGWVVSRHGALYAREYGWDASFEALVAEIAAKFLREFDPARERAWIAERDGERVGCVFVVGESASVAKLRMLLVEPDARGLGLGRRLVAECLRFARSVGYRELVLWTNDVLHAARRLYVEAGFTLVGEQRHTSFGHPLVGQTWSLDLAKGSGD
ncbi:MAG TPA: helix-turn-helix domain-containing GNAT family N-acetyltransferase [Casimicrobiaceae bacterium]|nr:helix-turn-helix domain-containing GNAT family N-acetyltransferase [Casimicrobiaceae bacterium]